MPSVFNLKQFQLGQSMRSGHTLYLDALLLPNGSGQAATKYILKENKHNKIIASYLEMAFTQLSKLFLAPGLTASQNLVVGENKQIWGVASEHICYVIHKNQRQNIYYQLANPQVGTNVEAITCSNADEIPLYFFDKLPHAFFKDLIKSDSGLSIDYASLANIMATCYFLEEDDLHKGNLGFYIVKENDKPRLKFFKIDHDLMFIDSIMSRTSYRFFHWLQTERDFAITARDLLNFPFLQDSANHYWPTKKSSVYRPCETKAYCQTSEVLAFKSLADVAEFKQAKWLAWYKHILMPVELMHQSLCAGYDESNPYERAQLALVMQAAIARQRQLQAVLFSIPEFRHFVSTLSKKKKKDLLTEIAGSNSVLRNQLEQQIDRYAGSFYGFAKGDTPLHIAIKLGEYRHEETLRMFASFINDKNDSGQYPLDVALINAHKQTSRVKEVSQDARYIMKHLLENGAVNDKNMDKTKKYLADYQFANPYLDQAGRVNDYPQLRELLTAIGEDHRYSLKLKKNLAISCIKACINANPPELNSILLQLKQQVNAHQTQAGGLAYIRQLRSNLWIIRQMRGLYGMSSTLWTINCLLNDAKTKSAGLISSPSALSN